MVEGIVGGTVDKNKGPAIGVEQEFVVERIGETKAMVAMVQLVILGDTRVFYQVIYTLIYNNRKYISISQPIYSVMIRKNIQNKISMRKIWTLRT